jgi:hypothetical protein
MKKVSCLIWVGTRNDPSYVLALLLALKRQTYPAWSAIVQTDGYRADVAEMLRDCAAYLPTEKISVHPTATIDGVWGYGCKTEGIALCTGDYICFQNDDNLVVPGFFAQLVSGIESGYDLVLCDIVHHYNDWTVLQTEPVFGKVDLCSWLAKAALVKTTPWPGNYREADGHFVERMAATGAKVGCVRRPLLIHNAIWWIASLLVGGSCLFC